MACTVFENVTYGICTGFENVTASRHRPRDGHDITSRIRHRDHADSEWAQVEVDQARFRPTCAPSLSNVGQDGIQSTDSKHRTDIASRIRQRDHESYSTTTGTTF